MKFRLSTVNIGPDLVYDLVRVGVKSCAPFQVSTSNNLTKWLMLKTTLQSNLSLAVTSTEQPNVFKGQYSVMPYVHYNSKQTCIRLPPILKSTFHCPLTGCSRQVSLKLSLQISTGITDHFSFKALVRPILALDNKFPCSFKPSFTILLLLLGSAVPIFED